MKSIIKPMNKKGVLGLNITTSFVLGLLTLALIGITVVIVMGALSDANISTNPVVGNATANIVGNVSEGVTTLFDSAVTWFALLAIVILILIIVTVIVVVKGIGGGGGGL